MHLPHWYVTGQWKLMMRELQEQRPPLHYVHLPFSLSSNLPFEYTMTPYRYTFFQGKPSIDLTEDLLDDAACDTTSAEVNRPKSYPTPSQSPEASSSQPPTHTTPDRIIKPLPRSQSTETSSRAIDRSIKIKVAIAL
jgi:hypothetical protein